MIDALLGQRRHQHLSGVRLEESAKGLRLVAERSQRGMATGRFDRPSSFVAFTPAKSGLAGLHFGGASWTQFGMPVDADASLAFPFHHSATLFSPEVVFPLYAWHPERGACLMAPLDTFHEQIVAVVDGELRWGWQGDLDRVEAGFSSELALLCGDSIREVMDTWGELLRARSGVPPSDRYADASTARLSYWTDNGAAYWYRREAGMDLQATLEAKCQELREAQVPIHAVELDSWFYPHQVSREVSEVGYLDEVPPTGMLRWEPRSDVLPEGVEGLRARLGDPPLILHSRHIASSSPYLTPENEAQWWIQGETAHPKGPELFERWFADAARWGACCYEQDWMWVSFFAIRQLREEAGRTRAWLAALDAAAARNAISLIWCMPTPADYAEATRLPRVVAVRTSDDYRYAEDPADLWVWFLVTNALVSALGLLPFKDVFFSAQLREGEASIDGDPHPEVEALLSAMSAGPVGIGDRIGRTDRGVVMRCCRADGVLIKPDEPIAALDGSLLGEPRRGEGLLWAETRSGRWRYVLALNVADTPTAIRGRLELGCEALLYDWRRGTAERGAAIDALLEPRDWAYYVVCPIEDGAAWIGDPDRYATMGDRRIALADDGTADVLGAVGEEVRIRSWTEAAGLRDQKLRIPGAGRIRLTPPGR